MTPAKKKATRSSKAKKPPAKVSWSDTIKQALEKKRQLRSWPDQPKPRDPFVQKVKKNAF
jgi:hypothetical protein